MVKLPSPGIPDKPLYRILGRGETLAHSTQRLTKQVEDEQYNKAETTKKVNRILKVLFCGLVHTKYGSGAKMEEIY